MHLFLWFLISLGTLMVLVLLVAIVKFKLARLDMTFVEFSRRLIAGGGFKNITVQELDRMHRSDRSVFTIIDLRNRKAETKLFLDSIPSPFDEFLKDVVMGRKYEPEKPIVLACDTGQMSRVAANILVEDEGFSNVYNLSGGIERWNHWQEKKNQDTSSVLKRFARCCSPTESPNMS